MAFPVPTHSQTTHLHARARTYTHTHTHQISCYAICLLAKELVERDKEFHSELDQCRQERSAVQDHMEEMSMENQDLQVGLPWVVGLMDVGGFV